MRQHTRFMTTLALAVAVAACADSYRNESAPSGSTATQARSGSTATAMPAAATTPGPTATVPATRLDAADRMFLIDAAIGGMAEVELGRMAQDRATLQPVRDFGRRMVQEHGQAHQELMRIATRLGVTPPTMADPARQAARDALLQLSGREFDRQYVEQQFTEHATALTAFQMASQRADDDELRAFARKTAPVIQQHLDMLRSIWNTNFPAS
jgi:putative membrane protein